MGSDRDPIEQAADGEADLHAVTTWEARSALDAVAWGLYRHWKWLFVGLGVLIVYYLFESASLSAIVDPRVMLLVLLSVVPAIILAAYIRFANIPSGEPLSVLFPTFLLGVLFAGFAIPFNALGEFVLSGADPLRAIQPILFFLLIVGPVEETVKLLAVRLFAFDHPQFDAVSDGAVYGAAAGLGFATIENALYITDALAVTSPFQQLDNPAAVLRVGGQITVSRALAGPGHVFYSAIAGYYLGLAKFNRSKAGPIVIKGIIIAALAHAAYNIGVGTVPDLLAGILGVTSFTGLVLYVVGFNTLVGSFLYRKLKRYREVYKAVGAAGSAGPAPAATGQQVDRRRASGCVGPYPATDGGSVFAHRTREADDAGNSSRETPSSATAGAKAVDESEHDEMVWAGDGLVETSQEAGPAQSDGDCPSD